MILSNIKRKTIREVIEMSKDLMIRNSTEEFLTFKFKEKESGIQVRYENENLWMTQKAMAELFNVEQPAIAKPKKHLFRKRVG